MKSNRRSNQAIDVGWKRVKKVGKYGNNKKKRKLKQLDVSSISEEMNKIHNIGPRLVVHVEKLKLDSKCPSESEISESSGSRSTKLPVYNLQKLEKFINENMKLTDTNELGPQNNIKHKSRAVGAVNTVNRQDDCVEDVDIFTKPTRKVPTPVEESENLLKVPLTSNCAGLSEMKQNSGTKISREESHACQSIAKLMENIKNFGSVVEQMETTLRTCSVDTKVDEDCVLDYKDHSYVKRQKMCYVEKNFTKLQDWCARLKEMVGSSCSYVHEMMSKSPRFSINYQSSDVGTQSETIEVKTAAVQAQETDFIHKLSIEVQTDFPSTSSDMVSRRSVEVQTEMLSSQDDVNIVGSAASCNISSITGQNVGGTKNTANIKSIDLDDVERMCRAKMLKIAFDDTSIIRKLNEKYNFTENSKDCRSSVLEITNVHDNEVECKTNKNVLHEERNETVNNVNVCEMELVKCNKGKDGEPQTAIGSTHVYDSKKSYKHIRTLSTDSDTSDDIPIKVKKRGNNFLRDDLSIKFASQCGDLPGAVNVDENMLSDGSEVINYDVSLTILHNKIMI